MITEKRRTQLESWEATTEGSSALDSIHPPPPPH